VPEQQLCANEGGEGWFYRGRARLVRHHGARRVMMARSACTCHVAILSFHASPYQILLDFRARTFFDPIFEGSFRGLLVLKMGHVAYRRKALDVFFPTV
jgi:hypothetical protein